MKKYFYLQFKRVLKLFPGILCVTLIMLIGFSMVVFGLAKQFGESDSQKKFKIAITGDTDNDYLHWGISAMEAFDETRFSVEFLELEEKEAKERLSKGLLSAYVVLPEGFLRSAASGINEPVTYVTSPGMQGLTTLFKEEITRLISDIVIYSQKGAFALEYALWDHAPELDAEPHLDIITFDYVSLILDRSKLYEVEEIGISDGLSLAEYYICSVALLFLVLSGLSFAAIYIKKDYTLQRLLVARGHSSLSQLFCEYLAHFLILLMQTALLLLALWGASALVPALREGLLPMDLLLELSLKLIPMVALLAAFNLLIFECSSTIIGGVFLHFFAGFALCYISGCIYPIYSFPALIQKISALLPMGIARSYLGTSFTYEPSLAPLAGMMGYALLFFAITLALRHGKLLNKRRGAQ